MRERGNMDFDYRNRCVVKVGAYDKPSYWVIFYGMTAREWCVQFNMVENWHGSRIVRKDGTIMGVFEGVADLKGHATDWKGRRPGKPYAQQHHFFNKRIMTDDERHWNQAVQADRDADRVRALYGPSGPRRAAEAASPEGGAGSGGEGEGVTT